MRTHQQLLVMAALGSLAIPATAAPSVLLIDNFDAPAAGLALSDVLGGGPASALTADAGIIGGWRFVELTAFNLAGLPAEATINILPARLTIANGPNVFSTTDLTYDSNGAGLGDIDLVGAGFSSVSFTLDDGDFTSKLDITLFDGATQASSSTFLPTAPPVSPFSIPFSDFTVVGPGDPFGSLDKIVITLRLDRSTDVILQNFGFTGVIPEGSTVLAALGVAGVVGVQLFRRRSAR